MLQIKAYMPIRNQESETANLAAPKKHDVRLADNPNGK
jgi:hypothetical protein